jgi:uncharacterized protein YyaL (SSP411 family)
VPNRLTRESSPYLLQHQNNPVEWYPWGEEAFARAREEQKPIFLSIGYSTCHWCHVMEHESFENAKVAEALNRSFVSIKVDREERPDVDRVYMTFVQATTGSGGWPMSVWLTPELEPFYGGTYFPPSSRWGRPGFLDILGEIARVWREERDRVVESAHSVVARLTSLRPDDGSPGVPGAETLDQAVQEFASVFDAARGGFGQAPKFPRPSELLFLLREHSRTGADEPRDMALTTLRAMALGGMRDHLGGGFHRYSVDRDWRVPHFEKMLYDQAQLALAYVEAGQLSGDAWYLDVAADTLEYVARDLRDPAGGFCSAEDADSVPPERAAEDPGAHKTEGAFYIWPDLEVGDALGPDAELFRRRYGVLPAGNAPSDPQGEFTGKNLLYVADGIDQIAKAAGRAPDDVALVLRRARLALRARRDRRPRPHLDDKVLTAWNGLAIAAFARAARAFSGRAGSLAPPAGEREDLSGALRGLARDAATFVRDSLWDAKAGTLLRRYRRGEAGVPAYAEDYACLVFGLLELFQTDGDPAWLEWAVTLQRTQDELFADPSGGGWYSSAGSDRSVIMRLKDDHDGAEPAASSMSVLNLLTLTHLVGEDGRYDAAIERTLSAFAGRAQSGRALPMMLAALSTYHAGVGQLVIAGDADRDNWLALVRVAGERYLPAIVVVPILDRHRGALERLLPWVREMRPRGGVATAYCCRRFACRAPVTSADELRAELGNLR